MSNNHNSQDFEPKNSINDLENSDNSPNQNQESLENQALINNQKLSELEEKLQNKEKELSELNDKLLRTLAELDNVRRRGKEELEKCAKYAITGFVSDLVLVAENFFLAGKNTPTQELESSATLKNYSQAVLMTEKELMKVLEKNQVRRINPLGEQFDHNFHEAIAQIESEEEEGKVLAVVQAGYAISDRLIRPALVSVAKKAS